ncbi:MAG: SAM-dependent methyltransferase [Caulobacteraceae bacterium]
MATFQLSPIGHVRGGREDAIDDDWGQSRARIELDPDVFHPEALAGLADFSHLEVIFLFDRVPIEKIEYGARHPRGREDWPLVGIFAQRGKNRPNRLGLCTCKIVKVDGLSVEVEGLDAIDGTPVMDLKPAMNEFLPREALRQPAWSSELMKDYW